MTGSERHKNGDRRPKKTVDARKHELADLVRYLARRAAERDYAAMQPKPSGKNRPRDCGGNDQ